MTRKKLAAVRGMNDLLPAEAPLWEWLEARVADWVRSYGYQLIRTPLLEHTELFVRGIGEVTEHRRFGSKIHGKVVIRARILCVDIFMARLACLPANVVCAHGCLRRSAIFCGMTTHAYQKKHKNNHQAT